MSKITYFSFLFLSTILLLAGCKQKDSDYFIKPPVQAHFTSTTGTYFVTSAAGTSFKVPVSLTTASNSDTKITVSISSPTGAAAGTQYNVSSTTLIIPAGKVVDSITINGLFNGYTATRKDTLIVTITGGDVSASPFNNQFRLLVQKACNVVSTDLIGNYANSTDIYNGAASAQPNYTATISNWAAISATSASVIIKNLGATSDNGWGAFGSADGAINPGISAILDWSNPGNPTVTISGSQNYFGSGATVSTINGTGTFNPCDQSFTIVCTVKYGVNGNSYVHTSILKR